MQGTTMRMALAACAGAVLLAACGGGGSAADSPAPAGAEKYLGTWSTCLTDRYGAPSALQIIAIERLNADRLSMTTALHFHDGPACDGTLQGSVRQPATTLHLTGRKHVGVFDVDTVVLAGDGWATKGVMTVAPDGRLLQGLANDKLVPIDAEGYPESLVQGLDKRL